MNGRRGLAVAAWLALIAGACGLDTVSDPTSAAPSQPTTTISAAGPTTSTTAAVTPGPPVLDQVFVADGTVLDKEGVGPQLCTFVRDSLPPQCEGLPVVGLDWRDVPWAETAGDTTWADARLSGIFKGSELVLTERPAEREPATREQTDYSTPCPEPEGGWTVRDVALATEDDFQRANEYSQRQAEFTGAWFDHLQEPKEFVPLAESSVANFSFTSNLDRHRVEIEKLYGGPMCVSEGKRPLAELREIQDRVFDVIFSPQAEAAGIYAEFGASGGADQFKGVVQVSVMAVVGDQAQPWLDEQFGAGVVELHSFLQPYEGPTEPEVKPLFPDQEALPVGVWVQGTTYDLSEVPVKEIWTGSLRPPVLTSSGVVAVMAVDGAPVLMFFPNDDGDPVVLSDGVGLPGSAGDFGHLVVADDGSRIAWSEAYSEEVEGAVVPSLLLEAALPSGEILNSTVFTGFDLAETEGRSTIGYASVVGYAGDNVVLGTGDGAVAAAAVWVPEQGVVRPAAGYGTAVPQHLTGNRAVLNQGDGPCAELVTIAPDGRVDPVGGDVVEATLGDCSAWMSPTESPDGSLIALGGDGLPDGEPLVLLTSRDGEEFMRMPIVGVPRLRSWVWDLVWMDDLTVLALIETKGNQVGREPWTADWAIYQCDLDDTDCHRAQTINFEPTDWYQVGLVRLGN